VEALKSIWRSWSDLLLIFFLSDIPNCLVLLCLVMTHHLDDLTTIQFSGLGTEEWEWESRD
jgi:hypothetical protein